MIRIIHGEEGTGKTKKIIELANKISAGIKGSTVFIDTDNSYMYDLDYSIRFINSEEYAVGGPVAFQGFLSGLSASDNDLEYVFCDSFLRIVKEVPSALEETFVWMDAFAEAHKLNIVLSVNEKAEQLPAFMQKYIED